MFRLRVFLISAFVVLVGLAGYTIQTARRVSELEARVKRLEFDVTMPSQRAFDKFHQLEVKINGVQGSIDYHIMHHGRPDVFKLIP